MPRPKTNEERDMIVSEIIELAKKHGRITTKDVAAMYGLHRTTAEKYMRMATVKGQLVRHGRLGIFRDYQTTIDFDMKRFTHKLSAAMEELRKGVQS
ncbi:hypothetical protein EAS17NKHM_025650 [Enterobacter asburiae]|uniref:DUF977 family protein n=1 Tax=Enterobacter asburiae TaxID=61645 RepID=UPI0010CA2DAC|nr:DUF977 family protein [Enterobacter asburiae]BBJ59169.1 hypothetical protein EAS17NKHM_025650 [Enterobacter asburiae]